MEIFTYIGAIRFPYTILLASHIILKQYYHISKGQYYVFVVTIHTNKKVSVPYMYQIFNKKTLYMTSCIKLRMKKVYK